MKKIFTYSLGALFLASALSLGSCKSQADDDLTRRTEQSINQGTPVVFTFDMESLPEQDARALTIESQTANGKNAGIKLTWAKDDKEKIYLLFKQGTKKAVVTATMTIGSYNESTKRYEGKFEVTAPSTINLAAGGVTVAGAMGVSELKDTGEATIASSNFFGEADRFITLPMYFTERPVNPNGSSYVTDMTLHFFGSVVGVTVSNVGGNMTYSPHEVTFKTEAFTTKGTMNILNASEANSAAGTTTEVLPTWTTTQTATTEQRVNFDHGDIKVGAKKTLFFWVHPSTYTDTKTLNLQMRTDNFDKELGATEAEITKSFNVKPLSQRRVHRIAEALQAPKGDLIISEVYMGSSSINSIWEFYNPTESDIDLSKYSLCSYLYNSKTNSYPSTPDYTSNLFDKRGRVKFLLEPSKTGSVEGTLKPHQTVIFYATGTTYNANEGYGTRPGLAYIVSIETVLAGNVLATTKYGKAFKVWQYSRHALVKDGKIVDNFFYGDGNTKYTIPAGNFMRKPGRNLPRPTMKVDVKNSDWAVRLGTDKSDFGYRYSFYYDRDRDTDPTLPANQRISDFYGNHWLGDATTNLKQHSEDGNVGVDENGIYNADYTKGATRSGNDDGGATLDKKKLKLYTPPTWWTKARATAADKR